MGDLASKREQNSSQNIENHQVGQSGTGNVANHVVSSITGTGNSLTIQSTDHELAMAAIEKAGQSSVEGARAFAEASGALSQISVANAATQLGISNTLSQISEDSSKVATSAINSSHQSVIQTLEVLKEVQSRAGDTVDRAVSASQQIAQQAAPVSPGAYAEAISGESAKLAKTMILAGVSAVILIGIVYIATKKN